MLGYVMRLMKRQFNRFSLALLVVLTTGLVAWVWAGDYDSELDPQARFHIEGVQVTRDLSNVWVEIHLLRSGDEDHDLAQEVRLVTGDQVRHEAADQTFAGSAEDGFQELWYKFWLQEGDLAGKMELMMNGGRLRVKINEGRPTLNGRGMKVFKTSNWGKSWLGF